MNPRPNLITFLAIGLLLPGLRAQQTLIVDAAGGPGVRYTDIQPAVDAASDGDVIRVRAGSYSAFRILGKGLAIIGDNRGTVHIDRGALIEIQGTAAGQRIHIQDLAIHPVFLTGTGPDLFRARQTAGELTLFRVDLHRTRLELDRCAQIHLLEVDLRSFGTLFSPGPTGPRIEAQSSYLQLSRSTIRGEDGLDSSSPGGKIGLVVDGCDVTIVACTIVGGTGLVTPAIRYAPGRGGTAIRATGGSAILVCGRTGPHAVAGGAGAPAWTMPTMTWSGDGGTGIELDQGASARFEGLQPEGGAVGLHGFGNPRPGAPHVLQGSATILIHPTSQPPLAALANPSGLPPLATLRLEAQPGCTALLALSLEHRYLPLAPAAIGTLLVAPAPAILLGPWPLPTGRHDLPVQIVPLWPRDLPVLGQYLVLSGNEIFLSNTVLLLVKS